MGAVLIAAASAGVVVFGGDAVRAGFNWWFALSLRRATAAGSRRGGW